MLFQLAGELNLKMAELRELDDQIFDLYSRLNGSYDHEKELYIPSEKNRRTILNEIEDLKLEVKRVGESLENDVWIQHLRDLLDGMEATILEDSRHPSKHLRSFGYSIIKTLEEEERKPEEKAEVLISKLSESQLFFEQVGKLCSTATDSRTERAITVAKNMQADFTFFTRIVESWLKDEKSEQTKKLYQQLIEKFNKLKEYALDFISDTSSTKTQRKKIIGDIPYGELLDKRYGVPLPWILTWYEDELNHAKEKVKELASKLDPTKTPIEVLRERIHYPYNSPEEMFKAMEEFLKIAKEKGKWYLDFPEGESCRVIGLKEMEKDVYPMGHSGGPDPITGGMTHTVALNQYNLRAFTKGWLMMMAIHEAYYGHNIQWIKIAEANLPKTFKIDGGKEVPLVEGLALRGEELLQHIYGDEAFPLFVAWRRLQTALRVYIDIGLFHLKTMESKDAERLYQDVMNFDEQTSKGLVEAHLESRGYFVCYLAGYKMIKELREKTRMEEKEVSNKLFSAGFVSMKCIEILFGIKGASTWESCSQKLDD